MATHTNPKTASSVTDTDTLSQLGAGELIERYRAGSLSPVTVIDAILERIAWTDPHLGAFAQVAVETAREAAAASAERWLRGHPSGLLDGVPVSLKDLLAVAGWPNRRGSLATSYLPAHADSPAAARLREHGAVILGTTATAEFGLGGHAQGRSGGATHNPWDPARTPGGSSSGAVAAVAAGLGPIAVGTDGGGSIRTPAAYSGVVGFKPTFGRVAHAPASFIGVPAHVGPIARSVSDAALLFGVLARPDRRDPFHLPQPPRPWHQQLAESLDGVRIGYTVALEHAGAPHLDPDVARAFSAAVDRLRGIGALVEEVTLDLPPAGPILRTLAAGRAALTVRGIPAGNRHLVGPEVQQRAAEGEALTGITYLEAEAARVALADAVAVAFEHIDLLLTPATSTVAPLLPVPGSVRPSGWSTPSYVGTFSLTRQPAISLPISLSSDGLPVAVQLVGRFGDDGLVLRAAHQLELSRGAFPRPDLAWIPG
jgi:aspartyl-tRNA(Asn)/glutamyl-tRNA(Gln) amidotransferase subunit A